MSIKSKIINIIASNPKFVTFGITLAISITVSATIGLISTADALTFHCHAFGVDPITHRLRGCIN